MSDRDSWWRLAMERTTAEHRAAVQRATDVRQYTVNEVITSAQDREGSSAATPVQVDVQDEDTASGSIYLIPAHLDRRSRSDPVPLDAPDAELPTSWLR